MPVIELQMMPPVAQYTTNCTTLAVEQGQLQVMQPVAQTHHQLHYTSCGTKTAAASNETLVFSGTPSLWPAYQNYSSHPFVHMKQFKNCLMDFHDIYTGQLPEICTPTPKLVKSDSCNKHGI